MDVEATSPPFDEAKALQCIRREAFDLKHALPRWMYFDDLLGAGWLGYIAAWERRPVHQYAKRMARYEMLAELRRFWGNRNGKIKNGVFKIEAKSSRFHEIAWIRPFTICDDDYITVDERRANEDAMDALVAELVLALPKPQAQVLWLKYVEQLTVAEVARRLGLCYSTAMLRHRSGIKGLRKLVVGERRVKLRPAVKNQPPSSPLARPTAPATRTVVRRPQRPKPESTQEFAARMRVLHALRDQQWYIAHPARVPAY